MAQNQFTCGTCGKQLLSVSRLYCSNSCKRKAEAERRQEAQPNRQCLLCGRTFKPKRADRGKCCSRGCGLAYNGFAVAVRKGGGRIFVRSKRKLCVGCGKVHGRASPYCTVDCKSQNAKTYYAPITHSVCRNCGVSFDRRSTGATRWMCSEVCANDAAATVKRKNRKARRALERGAVRAESVDPLEVFERDNWRCGICKRKTHKAKRGTYHQLAPELDHIVALANGGSHTWENVQCSCRECNGRKGARNYGQLLLFPQCA